MIGYLFITVGSEPFLVSVSVVPLPLTFSSHVNAGFDHVGLKNRNRRDIDK